MVTPPGASAPLKVVVDGGVLVNWEVLETHFPAEFPLALDQLAHGNPQLVATRWATGRAKPADDTLAYGMNFTVTCSDEEPFESAAQQFGAGQQAFPTFPPSVQAQAPNNAAFIRQACNAWNVPNSPDSVRAVTRSTIPTLLENGSFDGQTAASGAQYVARTLPNSIVTIYPGQAHGSFSTSPCAASVIVSFFDNPKAPNTSCVASVQPAQFDTTTSSPPPAESGSPAPGD
jgi:pimeloyl-ACP methyl ester carboxylesterase